MEEGRLCFGSLVLKMKSLRAAETSIIIYELAQTNIARN